MFHSSIPSQQKNLKKVQTIKNQTLIVLNFKLPKKFRTKRLTLFN